MPRKLSRAKRRERRANLQVLEPRWAMSGVELIEAEAFTRRENSSSHKWWHVGSETSGQGTFTGSQHFLQALTSSQKDSSTYNSSANLPYVEYDFTADVAGDYKLEIAAAGLSSSSDSLWIEVRTGTTADGSASPKLIYAGHDPGFPWQDAGTWQLTAGTHVIRVSMRESGTAFDALRITSPETVPTPEPPASDPPPSTDPPPVVDPPPANASPLWMEAEAFLRRQEGQSHKWWIVGQETSGQGSVSGSSLYLQALTTSQKDSSAINRAAAAPYVEFDFEVATAGLYSLDVSAAGISTSSDSLHVEVFSGGAAAGSPTVVYVSQGATFNWYSAGNWQLAAGKHTVRLSMRESGTAVDTVKITGPTTPTLPTPTPPTPTPPATPPVTPPSTEGSVYIEAEAFQRREAGSSHKWWYVGSETSGQGNLSGSSRYLQALTTSQTDSSTYNRSADLPYVEYEFLIESDGVYQLELLAGGISSSSDSLWTEVLTGELANDPLGASNLVQVITGTSGGFTWQQGGLWRLSAGTHTLRVSMRESGAAFDAIRFSPAAEPTSTYTGSRLLTATNFSQLRNLINTAKAGDVIEVGDGTYHLSSDLQINKSGSASAPIWIRAKNVNGARFTGPGRIQFNNVSYVRFEGFLVTLDATSPPNSFAGQIWVYESDHVRLTRNTFKLVENSSSGSGLQRNWVAIQGFSSQENRVDHNLFEGKAAWGNFVIIGGDTTGTSGIASLNDRVDFNHFKDFVYQDGNPRESVRIGTNREAGIRSPHFTRVTDNLFERTSGEVELISVKASFVSLLRNTVIDSYGAFTLRLGQNNVVAGNSFIDTGTSILTGGVRVYGDNHRIFNNYFENLNGTDFASPLAILSGNYYQGQAVPTGDLIAPASRNVEIINNTFVNSRPLLLGYNDPSRPLSPQYIKFVNNVVYGEHGFTELIRIHSVESLTFASNVAFPTGFAAVGATGFSDSELLIADPELSYVDGMFRPSTSGSPLIDAALAGYNYVVSDVDGDVRDAAPDIGADEYGASAAARYARLTPADVGPWTS